MNFGLELIVFSDFGRAPACLWKLKVALFTFHFLFFLKLSDKSPMLSGLLVRAKSEQYEFTINDIHWY